MIKNARNLMGDLLMVFSGHQQKLDRDNYDPNDNTVSLFFDAVESSPNVREAFVNLESSNPEMCDLIINRIEKSVNKESIQSLRYAFHNIVKSLNINQSQDALELEDLNSGVEDLTADEHRLEAAKGLDRFSSLNPDQKLMMSDLQDLILEGSEESLKTASNLIRTIFASKVPTKNVRLAYTTLNTQTGEPFQLCPKAQKQIGWAIPMELSKCRDFCIDSRKTRDGKITCAYQDWLRVVADNQSSVMARLDASVINQNDDPTLNDITRPGPADSETPKEQVFEESEMLKQQNKFYSREELLENSIEKSLRMRNLNDKFSENNKRVSVANTQINNTEDDMGKFNLKEHVKALTINDQLEEYREFFRASLGHETPSEMTNKPYDNSKYEKATSMESLVEEKRTGSPESKITMEENMASVRKENNKVLMTPQNETLDSARKNDKLDYFMQTLEEKLEDRRTNKQ